MRKVHDPKVTIHSHHTPIPQVQPVGPIYAVDFGQGKALQVWGPEGLITKASLKLPRIKGGKTPKDDFIGPLAALLKIGNVVFESPTAGSSGAEKSDIEQIASQSSYKIYTVTARAVKNYRFMEGLPFLKGGRYARDGAPPPQTIELHEQQDVHVDDARIIYTIATERPWQLREWHIAEVIQRIHTSVRPSDKRGYRDQRSDEFMKELVPWQTLMREAPEIAKIVGNGKGDDYSRSFIMPFAMALTEPALFEVPKEKRRKRFEKLIGLYEHGYPSFYRRMTTVWMQGNAKLMTGASRHSEIKDRAIIKQAWNLTRHQVRHLFHLSSIPAPLR